FTATVTSFSYCHVAPSMMPSFRACNARASWVGWWHLAVFIPVGAEAIPTPSFAGRREKRLRPCPLRQCIAGVLLVVKLDKVCRRGCQPHPGPRCVVPVICLTAFLAASLARAEQATRPLLIDYVSNSSPCDSQ